MSKGSNELVTRSYTSTQYNSVIVIPTPSTIATFTISFKYLQNCDKIERKVRNSRVPNEIREIVWL